MSDRRAGSDRKAVNLLVKLAHAGVDEFVEKYATNLSPGGMFIRARDPKPVGTLVNFRVELADGKRVMQGRAEVKWVRGPDDPEGPPGMGVAFEALDIPTQQLVDRMLASSAPAPPAIPMSAPVPPKSAPAPVAPRVAKPKSAPPAAPPPQPPPPPEALPSEVMEPDEPNPFDAFGAPPPPPPGEIEIDLDVLVASTDPPPPPTSSGSGMFDIDLEAEAEVAPAALLPPSPPPPPPAARAPAPRAGVPAKAAAPAKSAPPQKPAPPPPPPEPPLPELRRPSRDAPAQPSGVREAPALLQQLPLAPHLTRRAPGRPVYLTPPATIDATGPVIGIDLGTTNSCSAILNNGKPIILASKDGYNTIPSIVAMGKHGLLVGHRAKGQMLLNPSQSIYGAKRLVGRDFDSPTVRTVKERFHYEVIAGPDGKAAVTLGGQPLALEEVQGLVLRECKGMAEQHLGRPVTRAVITCPAYYSDQQREAIRRAAAMAGLKVERVLNEPTAAALAFGLNRELTRKVLVYDLGGGTFDATLLRIDKNVFEVLSTGGDIFLGGLDFDNLLVDVLLQKFQAQHNTPFSGDAVALSRVTELAERAKVALSERTTFDLHLPMLMFSASGQPMDLKGTLTRDELNASCKALVDRTIEVVREVLTGGSMKPADVDDVILVGGMSRMPMVRERLKTLFNKTPHASVNADEAVALGAALYAGTVDKVSSVVLIDVVPMTIGYGVAGGAFKRVIERNAPLPATKSFNIANTREDETVMEIELFQGEDTNAAANEYLGTLRIEGLPKGPKGTVQVMVTVRVDGECVVHVEAKELRTRKTFSSTLATRYSPEEIRSRLGVTQAKPDKAATQRAEELAERGGRFWKFLKRVVGKA